MSTDYNIPIGAPPVLNPGESRVLVCYPPGCLATVKVSVAPDTSAVEQYVKCPFCGNILALAKGKATVEIVKEPPWYKWLKIGFLSAVGLVALIVVFRIMR